jgi:hypothetical protein
MICIAISQAAFDAIATTLPLGSVGFENKTDEHGQKLIWLPPEVVDRLRSLRGAGESVMSFCGSRLNDHQPRHQEAPRGT